jgi:hypothetical protein
MLSAIAGDIIGSGIAEACFGIPEEVANQAWNRLPEKIHAVLVGLYARAGMTAPWLGSWS